jgi:hypothetical protein
MLVFGIRRVARFNILGSFLVVTGTSLLAAASKLVSQPDGFYRANGYLVLLILAGLLGWPLAAWRRRATRAEA